MRTAQLSIYLLLTAGLVGCEAWNTVKVDNPVFGPAPPRTAMTNDAPGFTRYAENTSGDSRDDSVMTVGLSQSASDSPDPINRNQVVATVNGRPVFAGEVLDRYAVQLTQAAPQISDREFQELRNSLIKRDLDHHVDRKLLLDALLNTLEKEQYNMLTGYIDEKFAEEIEVLKKQFKVSSLHELEKELNKQETSLDELRRSFGNERMAMEFLGAKAQVNLEIGRAELFEYYQDHLSDYAYPAKALWQQIVIDFDKNGGKEKAFTVLETVVDELRRGHDFSRVAATYSSGPKAKQGGQWDWTQAGSVANEEVEQMLFQLPIGNISRVIVTEKDYRLVRVIDRQPAGYEPFEDLQDEIKTTLQQNARQQATKKVLAELKESAIVKTIFDDESKPSDLLQGNAAAGFPF